jgi:hypothetical protein
MPLRPTNREDGSFLPPAPPPPPQSADEQQINKTLKHLFLFLVTLVLLILIFMLISKSPHMAYTTFFAVGGAYLFSGAIGGFLFAIPRIRKKSADIDDSTSSWYDENTNLEEVSDWLTKIIVGLTLTQFNVLLGYLNSSAVSIATAFKTGSYDTHLYPWAYGLIVFFIACGFAIGYLWTRINFALILTVSRRRLNDIANIKQQTITALQEKDTAKRQAMEAKQEEQQIAKEFVATASQANVKQVAEMEMGEEMLRNDQNKPRLQQMALAELSNRPILLPADRQKGRWGGVAEKNGKKLFASVEQHPKLSRYYNVALKVASATNVRLTEPVCFFVHESFGFSNDMVISEPNAEGIAQINLVAYEAFTAGALCMDGTTLELDLNEEKGFPNGFYWKKFN